jgi:CheY-like chemotaxis protein
MEDHKKVLVIDEDQEFIDGCSNTFNGNLYRMQFVSNRQNAQRIINGGFDLIIIGSLSPAGEAFALQQWIKRHPIYRYIPVLVIDACFHERRWRGWRQFEGFQIEAEEYDSKPLEPIELLPLIEKLCTSIVNDERHQTVEILWQAFLALDKDHRRSLADRIVQLKA